MKTSVEIEFKNVPLVVKGDYTEGDSGTAYHEDLSGTPPTDSQYEIENIFVESVDIYDLFSYDDISRIEELVLIELES